MTKIVTRDESEVDPDKEVERGDYLRIKATAQHWLRYVRDTDNNGILVAVDNGNIWNSSHTIDDHKTTVAEIENEHNFKIEEVVESDEAEIHL